MPPSFSRHSLSSSSKPSWPHSPEGITRQVELDLAVDEQARSVKSPTLVINCAHDQIVTQTPELAASIPGAMCQQISAGHLAYFEGADEFLSLATEFLRRHDA